MSDVKKEERAALLAPMNVKQLLGVGLIGLMIGVIVWAISAVVDQYVLQVLFCQNNDCGDMKPIAGAIGAVIGAALGLFSLVKLRVVRPLLVVVAAMAALWNLTLTMNELPIYGIVLATALLYAAIYAVLTWLARLRSMYVVLILFVAIIIAIRFALTS